MYLLETNGFKCISHKVVAIRSYVCFRKFNWISIKRVSIKIQLYIGCTYMVKELT